MVDVMKDRQAPEARAAATRRSRLIAWILILIVNAGLVAWGAMAYCAAFGLTAVAVTITAFRRGEGWAWWALLVGNTITLVSAMTYDWTVNAIGPFELTEYLGLALVWGALAVTAPFRAAGGLGRRAA